MLGKDEERCVKRLQTEEEDRERQRQRDRDREKQRQTDSPERQRQRVSLLMRNKQKNESPKEGTALSARPHTFQAIIDGNNFQLVFVCFLYIYLLEGLVESSSVWITLM